MYVASNPKNRISYAERANAGKTSTGQTSGSPANGVQSGRVEGNQFRADGSNQRDYIYEFEAFASSITANDNSKSVSLSQKEVEDTIWDGVPAGEKLDSVSDIENATAEQLPPGTPNPYDPTNPEEFDRWKAHAKKTGMAINTASIYPPQTLRESHAAFLATNHVHHGASANIVSEVVETAAFANEQLMRMINSGQDQTEIVDGYNFFFGKPSPGAPPKTGSHGILQYTSNFFKGEGFSLDFKTSKEHDLKKNMANNGLVGNWGDEVKTEWDKYVREHDLDMEPESNFLNGTYRKLREGASEIIDDARQAVRDGLMDFDAYLNLREEINEMAADAAADAAEGRIYAEDSQSTSGTNTMSAHERHRITSGQTTIEDLEAERDARIEAATQEWNQQKAEANPLSPDRDWIARQARRKFEQQVKSANDEFEERKEALLNGDSSV